jgi:hypothetical protein
VFLLGRAVQKETNQPEAQVIVLRILGAIDLCALAAVVMPGRWMAAGHACWD